MVDSTSFYLREFIYNPFFNIPARHIHSINACKDGFMIGTGERYPDGWHFYMRTPTPETFEANSQAFNDFTITRLTS
ncbi:hypothetical protein, partial [Staphylococcus aureus]